MPLSLAAFAVGNGVRSGLLCSTWVAGLAKFVWLVVDFGRGSGFVGFRVWLGFDGLWLFVGFLQWIVVVWWISAGLNGFQVWLLWVCVCVFRSVVGCGLRSWVCVFAGFLVLLPIGVSHL